MFNKIVVRYREGTPTEPPVDLGTLAEALLFYEEVVLVVGYGGLRPLLQQGDIGVVLGLLDEGVLKLAYEEDLLAVVSQKSDGGVEQHHDACIVSSPKHALQNAAPAILRELIGRSGRGRRLAQRLIDRTDVLRHSNDAAEHARVDLATSPYVQSGVRLLLSRWAPEYEGPSDFRLTRSSGQLRVETNIDFVAANHFYHLHTSPDHSTISPSSLLVQLVGTQTLLRLGAQYGGDLSTDGLSSALMQLQVQGVFSLAHRDALAQFQQFALDDSRSIAEAVRGGYFSLEDVARLLPNARRFRQAMRDAGPNTSIAEVCFREAHAGTWVDALPVKSMRWALFTGAGLMIDAAGGGGIATATGVALSGIDAFFLDTLLKGWRPTQFVQELQFAIDSKRPLRLTR
jgi:hypothetical protein